MDATTWPNHAFQPSQSTMPLRNATEDYRTAGPSRILPSLPTMNQPLSGSWTSSDWDTNVFNGWTNPSVLTQHETGYPPPPPPASENTSATIPNVASAQDRKSTSQQPSVSNIDTILKKIENIKNTACTSLEVLQSPGAGGMTTMEGYNKIYLLIEGMLFAADTLKFPTDIMTTLHHMKYIINRIMAKDVMPFSHATIFSSLHDSKFEVVDLDEMSENNGYGAIDGITSEASPTFSSTGATYANNDSFMNEPLDSDISRDADPSENFALEDEYVILRTTEI